MIYKLDLRPLSPFASPPTSGFASLADLVQFVPWQPSAWPDAPSDCHEFVMVLKRIFEVSMLMEINNVIEDANARNRGLEHRGHVVAISLLCALVRCDFVLWLWAEERKTDPSLRPRAFSA